MRSFYQNRKNRKIVCLFACVMLVFATAGCKSDTSAAGGASPAAEANSVSDVIDVDLTVLSSTMVYSEVCNMLYTPEDYLGKTVKMNGTFALYYAFDENNQPVMDQKYYACVIRDATACCQQGMEFILAGDAKYPDDYPELDSDITVIGEFQTYMEGEDLYCHLVNARLL